MEEYQIAFFQNILQRELMMLLKSGDETVMSLMGQENTYADVLDQASNDADLNFKFRIKDRESRLIRKVKEALERIEDGTYGICEDCGEEISLGRLTARPVATRCIACKALLEKMEKLVVL